MKRLNHNSPVIKILSIRRNINNDIDSHYNHAMLFAHDKIRIPLLIGSCLSSI